MSGIGARLKRIECRVIETDYQRRFERLKRSYFNAFQVSDAALIESLVSAFEGKEPPKWVDEKFQEPIPHGSAKDRINEAEAWAHEMMKEAAGLSVTEAELTTQLNTVLRYVQRSSIERSEEHISRLQRLMGESYRAEPILSPSICAAHMTP